MTNDADRARLLQIAREAVTACANRAGMPATYSGLSAELESRQGGAFVTLHHRGELRGCIGHVDADQPLVRIVAQCAISAATSDPRFAPVSAKELADISVELSLLGPLEPINGPEDIEVGRHGVVVGRDGRRGLLLPQVATEWKWDATMLLAQTCRKAGLPIDAWKHGASMWRFEAEVFGETLLA